LIDHPFLSFKDLSEDELQDKTADIHKKLSKAHMWGSSRDIISQLEWMLEMIEEEKMERLKKQNFDTIKAMFPETVESDPEYSQTKSSMDDTNSKVVKPAQTKKTPQMPMPLFDKEYVNKDSKSGK
jgi:hypothetical protein